MFPGVVLQSLELGETLGSGELVNEVLFIKVELLHFVQGLLDDQIELVLLVAYLIQYVLGVSLVPLLVEGNLGRPHLVDLHLRLAFEGVVPFESFIKIENRLFNEVFVLHFRLFVALSLPLQNVLEHGTPSRFQNIYDKTHLYHIVGVQDLIPHWIDWGRLRKVNWRRNHIVIFFHVLLLLLGLLWLSVFVLN